MGGKEERESGGLSTSVTANSKHIKTDWMTSHYGIA